MPALPSMTTRTTKPLPQSRSASSLSSMSADHLRLQPPGLFLPGERPWRDIKTFASTSTQPPWGSLDGYEFGLADSARRATLGTDGLLGTPLLASYRLRTGLTPIGRAASTHEISAGGFGSFKRGSSSCSDLSRLSSSSLRPNNSFAIAPESFHGGAQVAFGGPARMLR